MGLETFDDDFRINTYNKRFRLNETKLKQLSQELYSVCLLVCVEGQTKEMIRNDIEQGMRLFQSITINVFTNNGTLVKRDDELYRWFAKNFAALQTHPNVELLLDNHELGVFEQ